MSDTADLEAMLAPLGQPVLKAVPWSEALTGLLDQDPACILVDARHTWAAGFEVAHRLRGHERARHIPLLLLGASACDQAGLMRDHGLEMVDCLFEPIPPDLLRAKVGMYIGLHRRERAARSALDRVDRIEAASHERERMLNTLLGNLPGMVYRCLNEPGYPMAYVSEGALPLTGYSPEDFTAQRVLWEELVHPDDVAQVWDDVQAAVSARKPFTLTYRLRTRTGEERWVWERGVAVHEPGSEFPLLEGFITDITALKRTEQHQVFLASVGELIVSSLDYETTLAHVMQRAVPELGDVCTLEVLEPDGTIRRVAAHHREPAHVPLMFELARLGTLQLESPIGPGAAIRTGKTELLTDISDDLLVRYAPNARALELLRGLHLTSGLSVPLHARGRTFGALSFYYTLSGRHYDRETQLLCEELARRAALALDNARLYREAQHAVKLRDEFLSVASHELKTPLTPLNLKLTALSRELQQWAGEARAARLQHHLDMARRQVRKLTTLINTLLDITRISQGELALQLEETDLGELLREVVDWFAPEAARAGSELRVEGAARVSGRWDQLRLEQVVTNLLSNAIRYGAGRPIHVRTEVEGDRVRLMVRDQGVGIPPETQARLFDKFGKFERATSERHSGGLGLGLYITRCIVEALGGHIRVESRPGEGSTFTVELPRSAPADSRR